MRRILILIGVLIVSSSLYSQEKRLALVIGNSAYEFGGILKNPVNDAYAMKRALSGAGFEVLEHYNLDQGDLKRAIDEFGLKLRNYDVGLFFYAGHGIQTSGNNFLIPVDANLITEQQVEYDCVQADRVLGYMDASGSNVNIVILDACRNNPFERSWTRSTAGKGLAYMDAPSGTLIAYATAPGRTASDGTGMNGLYTEAILESMEIPGLTILQMFQNVRSLVAERSDKLQTPWEATSMVGDFYLMPGESALERDIIDTHNEGALTGEFTDDRDGEIYQWIRLGNQVWMTENVNHYFKDYGHYCYDNIESNCDLYGRLYQWNLAQEACPSGWHLPSDEEWKELEIYFGMSRVEAEKEGWRGEDEVNQSKIVSFASTFPGYRKIEDQMYYELNAVSFYWTSSGLSSGDAWFRAVVKNRAGANRRTSNKLHANSVRCVKN